MLRCLFLFATFIILGIGTARAIPVKKKAVLIQDSSVIKVRLFNKSALKNYNKQPEFQYGETDLQPSAWTRFWRWFWHLFDFMNFGNGRSAGFWYFVGQFLKYLIILLGFAAIVFVILKLAGIDAINIFRKRSLSTSVPYSESDENIHEIDFDMEIERAVSQNNYRLAVRLLYLKCLKQLSDASLIRWQPDKTNSAYVTELNESRQGAKFKLLTRQFEYVWYGEFAIDGNVFRQISALFQEFKKELS